MVYQKTIVRNIMCRQLSDKGGLAQWLVLRTTDQGVPGSRPGRVPGRCGLEQVIFTPCLVLANPGSCGRKTDLDRL